MKRFMDEDVLLPNDAAKKIYDAIQELPIMDYHCHLNPQEIAENKRFRNITEIWLGGDHYKWRLMRTNGVEEKYITGDASDYEKFEKFCETVADAIGSPIYHWTHLELKRYFDCALLLSKETAPAVWEHCNQKLQSPEFSVWGILDKFKVKVVCTTDDPADGLEHHQKIREQNISCKVLPALRPSKAMNIEEPGFVDYIAALGKAAGASIRSYADLMEAFSCRIKFFHDLGCRLSDHALDPPVFENATLEEVAAIFQKALRKEALSSSEIKKYKTALMVDLGKKYHEMGWVMQLHMGTLRNNNTKMFQQLGPDTGYDCITDESYARETVRLLDTLATTDSLPKTVLYSLNPNWDDILGTVIGCFQGGGVRGKIQFGSAWWFNDTKTGMQKQMTALANLGMLSCFVGMLTDSRSFLSYTRHEYFRRVLANLLGRWVEAGEFPEDYGKLCEIAQNISYYNAEKYFQFK